MPVARTAPIAAFTVLVVLLAVLAGTAGLSPGGWVAGLACGLVVCGALAHALHRSGTRTLGPANSVTLSRAMLVGAVAALTVAPQDGTAPVAPLATIAGVALALDWVDGQVARRTGSSSALGARFDMEIDSLLVLLLAAYVARSSGGWVLAIGLMRYAFLAASWALPWMRAELPPRQWRKVVAATQGIVLLVAACGVLPATLTTVLLAASLTVLVESFGRDTRWLWRHRAAVRSVQARPAWARSAQARPGAVGSTQVRPGWAESGGARPAEARPAAAERPTIRVEPLTAADPLASRPLATATATAEHR
ncbi:CDP-alcohol phosphatidyltransferase family protein [Plantactinospora sp. GCM10030261]|uniref:CDP-alcohol phosphatidyltransferase family protein n=1 Tax=Plantactinospora sp. GCM10030261 TaxID=3273420 RepID=UPI003620ED40